MLLKDMSITEFTNMLASDAPAPGGGSSSALVASLGTALTHMVTALTINRKAYEDQQGLMLEIMPQLKAQISALTDLIDKDTAAYNAVGDAMSLPKDTDDEKAKRTAAIQSALKEATKTPFEVMECCQKSLELTSRAVGHTNKNAASDLGVSALSLKAGVQGAWLNVLINLGSIKDTEFVSDYKTKAEQILAKSCEIADKVYAEIESNLAL